MRVAVLHGPGDLRIETRRDAQAGSRRGRARDGVRAHGRHRAEDVRARRARAHGPRRRSPSATRAWARSSRWAPASPGGALGDLVLPGTSAACGACAAVPAREERALRGHALAHGLLRRPPPGAGAASSTQSLHRVPAGLAPEVAALADNLACVLKGHAETPGRAGETALVLGTGPAGPALDVGARARRRARDAAGRRPGSARRAGLRRGGRRARRTTSRSARARATASTSWSRPWARPESWAAGAGRRGARRSRAGSSAARPPARPCRSTRSASTTTSSRSPRRSTTRRATSRRRSARWPAPARGGAARPGAGAARGPPAPPRRLPAPPGSPSCGAAEPPPRAAGWSLQGADARASGRTPESRPARARGHRPRPGAARAARRPRPAPRSRRGGVPARRRGRPAFPAGAVPPALEPRAAAPRRVARRHAPAGAGVPLADVHGRRSARSRASSSTSSRAGRPAHLRRRAQRRASARTATSTRASATAGTRWRAIPRVERQRRLGYLWVNVETCRRRGAVATAHAGRVRAHVRAVDEGEGGAHARRGGSTWSPAEVGTLVTP